MSILLKILLILTLIIVGIILFYLIRFQIWKIKENKKGWRTRAINRDSITYQEKINGKWEKIRIDGEMCREFYFKTEQNWTEYPEWAQNRKKIMERVIEEHSLDQTEYENMLKEYFPDNTEYEKTKHNNI